jgi:uncharacterized protein
VRLVAVAAVEVSVATSVVEVLAVTQEQARRFLVARQFLAPARSLTGVEGVLEVFRRFGSVQFDPVAVAGRSHDLVLHARVAGYRSHWCDDLYASREIVESTNKALSFVPVDEFPWFRQVMGRKGPTFHKTALADNAEVAARVLERIRVQGPVSSSDFPSQSSRTKNWFGAPENAVRAALEALTVNGVIGLARREGNRRYYDLLERLLPEEVLAKEVPEADQVRHKLLSRHRAHGLLAAGGAGEAFARIADPAIRRAVHEQLVADGELHRVAIAGIRGPRFVVSDDVDLLRDPPDPAARTVAFIAPYDALLWDTSLLVSLFGFTHVFEGYFPSAKRRWGYYVLPVLFGDRLVGRIEPRIDHERHLVSVLGLWWEDDFSPEHAEEFVDAMRTALGEYARFAGADQLEWAPHLTAELRLFPLPS